MLRHQGATLLLGVSAHAFASSLGQGAHHRRLATVILFVFWRPALVALLYREVASCIHPETRV